MKKIIKKKVAIAALCVVMMGLASCVKQKNCDCGITGKFIYYENPEEIIYCGYPKDVNALIISDDREYCIDGSIPKKFQVRDTLQVNACLKKVSRNGPCLAHGIPTIYKLKCIEKEY